MKINQNNNEISNNEIDLKDLLSALWRQKVLIIIIVLIITIATGLYSMFVITPVYSTNMNFSVSMPSNYTSKYGVFNLPVVTNQQYVNLVSNNKIINNTFKDMGYNDNVDLDVIKKSISASGGSDPNNINIHIASVNSEGLVGLDHTLYENYMEYVTVTKVEDAVDYYINDYVQKNETMKVELKANQELISLNEALLNNTSKIIDDEEINNTVRNKIGDAEFVVVTDIVNPIYADIQKDIIDMQQRGFSLNYTVTLYESYLEELRRIKNDIINYYNTGDYTTIKSSMKSITISDISFWDEPVVSVQNVSPSIKKNVVIAAVFGIMFGALVAFIKEFWFKKA